MLRLTVLFVVLATILMAAASCTTYKMWNVADSDRDTSTVSLFYEYRKFESPQVDERAGVEIREIEVIRQVVRARIKLRGLVVGVEQTLQV